jgi:hypothetical protein
VGTTAPGTIDMVDVECPVPRSQDGLVPEDACDSRITDATLVQMGGMPRGPSAQIRPIVLGHEPAGEMAGVGDAGRKAGSGGHQPEGRTVRDYRPPQGARRHREPLIESARSVCGAGRSASATGSRSPTGTMPSISRSPPRQPRRSS